MNLFIRIISSVIIALSFRELWDAIYQSNTNLATQFDVSSDMMSVYTTVSVILYSLLAPSICYEISSRVANGQIASDFQKPWDYQFMYLSKCIGNSIYGLIFVAVPLVILNYPIISAPLTHLNFSSFFYFVISLVFAMLLSFFVNFIIGLFAFVFTEVWGIDFIKKTIQEFCSGAIVPLWFFPSSILFVVSWLPFKGIYSIPLSILIGKITGESIISNLMFQLIWIVFLSVIGRIGIELARRKLVISGG
ncbi:ABC transporter permease [Paenibacillus humicus]|uniref:ABC transporter permease n=1 Tax=Paenibacillus humicus TaxID=412861 RepID=UPI003D29DD7C